MEKTYSTKANEIKREWHLLDASDQVLGRLASRAAHLLMGKHKPTFTRHLDMGDFVVIINTEKVRVTGNKAGKTFYYRHSMYPGGFKSVSLEKMLQSRPAWVIEHAVKGMLPHNRLGDRLQIRLKVYVGEAHPHRGQVSAVASETVATEK